jgi:coenzyme F420-0:L-glutamate ligase / coenzyme F420-1:gamma-L-glutamate ligase
VSGRDLTLIGVRGMGAIGAGADIAAAVVDAVGAMGHQLASGDVLVVSSTIVSKAENRYVSLRDLTPSSAAKELAATVDKDPRLVELILRESTAIVRAVPGVLIVRHRLGFISANAGIDFSNVDGDEETAILLPADPDGSAEVIRQGLERATGAGPIAVVLADTHGRAFRKGNVGVAIGISGLPALLDLRGEPDFFGRPLQATSIPLADEVATAAGLVSGQAAEGIPVVIVRGLAFDPTGDRAAALSWPPELDLFA